MTRRLLRETDGFFHVAAGRPRSWVSMWLYPVASFGLVLPVEAVAVDIRSVALHVDQKGIVSLPLSGQDMLTYRVGMAPESQSLLRPGGNEPPQETDSSTVGISDRIAELAAEVAGSGTAFEQASRLERYLAREYEYSLDLVGVRSDTPLEDFLFQTRRGHCEYFASAMVLMLRSQGIPARLATGYLGAEYNPFEGHYVVRQSNAHAWVEAFVGEEGWRVFDPTPPSGRPLGENAGWSTLLTQIYDFALFRWDRYVLGYGFNDQLGFARRLAIWWYRMWARGRPADVSQTRERPTPGDSQKTSPTEGDELDWKLTGADALLLALLGLLVAWWIWRHRPPFSGARAYRRLRSRLERDPRVGLTSSLPPLRVAEQVAVHRPAARVPASRVIEFYLRESFGGEELSEEERRELQMACREALRRLRKTA
jgi:transglutaminase-like putative cysteine protease